MDLDQTILEKTTLVEKAYHEMVAYNRQVVEKWLEKLGMPDAKIMNLADSYAQIGVEIDGTKRAFELYIRDVYGTSERELGINFPCFGTFKCDDQASIAFCQALGFFAHNMKDVEKDLAKCAEAKKLHDDYWTLRNELWHLNEKKHMIEREAEEAARQAKLDLIASKIIPGAKIRIGWTWDKKPLYDEIDRVSEKCFWRKHGYGCRERIKDAVSKIFSDVWAFAN